MTQDPNPAGMGLIIVGTLLSFGRDWLSQAFIQLQAWLSKQPENPRLRAAVQLYLMIIGMVFTLVGALVLLHLINF